MLAGDAVIFGAVLDRGALEAFMLERATDREPSVVVFAIDHLPGGMEEGGARAPLLHYLAAGGKAVWVGVPPLLRPRDPRTREPPELAEVDRDGPRRLLGVGHGRSTSTGTVPSPRRAACAGGSRDGGPGAGRPSPTTSSPSRWTRTATA